MKIYFYVFIIASLLLVNADNVFASEIFGRISTDPRELPGQTGGSGGDEQTVPSPDPKKVSQGSSGLIITNRNAATSTTTKDLSDGNVKVLGIAHIADNSLIRGRDRRIYLVKGEVKKYIPNLKELAKYRGQKIFDVTDEDLARLEARGHFDGELVREKGTAKVFVLRQGKKQHIINLAELRAHYFGLEIYNISREEMEKYE